MYLCIYLFAILGGIKGLDSGCTKYAGNTYNLQGIQSILFSGCEEVCPCKSVTRIHRVRLKGSVYALTCTLPH